MINLKDIITNYFLSNNYTYENISLDKIKTDLRILLNTNVDLQVNYNKDIKVFEGVDHKPIVKEGKKLESITIVFTDFNGSVNSTNIKLDA